MINPEGKFTIERLDFSVAFLYYWYSHGMLAWWSILERVNSPLEGLTWPCLKIEDEASWKAICGETRRANMEERKQKAENGWEAKKEKWEKCFFQFSLISDRGSEPSGRDHLFCPRGKEAKFILSSFFPQFFVCFFLNFFIIHGSFFHFFLGLFSFSLLVFPCCQSSSASSQLVAF